MERLMTTEEVAELLRIETVTVRRLIGRGELTAYRIAGEYRIAPADLEKFLDNQRVVVDGRAKVQTEDKFTDQARRVLALASEEARQYNHPGVGTEHLLLALLSEDEGIASRTLRQLQVQKSKAREQVEALHPAGEEPAGEGLPGMTAQGKTSLELAVQEARGFDHHYLGTEHLLLGLLREEEGSGGQVLRNNWGITLEQARELIRRMLQEDQAAHDL